MSLGASERRDLAIRRSDATLALWAACWLGVMSLPRALFPWAWVAAFVLPPWLFYVLRHVSRRSFVTALLVSAGAHVGTVFVAQWLAGPIGRETALGCSLLPPMVFLASRREGEDATWALFMAFCIFLISVILGRAQPMPGPDALTIWLFIATAIVALRSSSVASAPHRKELGRRRMTGMGFGPRRIAIGSAISNTLTTLALAMILMQALTHFGPDSEEKQRRREAARSAELSDRSSVGLSDRFEFGESARKIDIQASELVRVTPVAVPGARLPDEIYLRTTQFEIPGLDRWYRARPQGRRVMPGDSVAHRGDVQTDISVQRLDVEITGPADSFLFLPPGTIRVEGLPDVLGNLAREDFSRQDEKRVHYTVEFQDRRALAFRRAADPAYAALAQRLPSNFAPYRDLFQDLLRRSGVRGSDSPLQIAERLTALLQSETRYALREPEGPYPHTILNFLEGERVGFCMHYASTVAFCLRLAGIPSRIGVGLYGADPVDEEFVLGSQHAHAWVEVPIEGLGWVVVDPTPAAATSLYGTSSAARSELPSRDPTDDRTGSALARWIASPTTLWILGVLLAAVALSTLSSRVPRANDWQSRVRDLSRPVEPHVTRLFATLLRELAKIRPRTPGESLQAYGEALGREGGDVLPTHAITAAFDTYEEIRFGQREANAERRAILTEALDRVRALRT